MDCTIRMAKTKALISFAVTAKLICVFVFVYAKIRFSHDIIIRNFGTGLRKFSFAGLSLGLRYTFDKEIFSFLFYIIILSEHNGKSNLN